MYFKKHTSILSPSLFPLKFAPSKMYFKKHISKLNSQKMHVKIAITYIFFIIVSIISVKGKIDINRNLIMHDYHTILGF